MGVHCADLFPLDGVTVKDIGEPPVVLENLTSVTFPATLTVTVSASSGRMFSIRLISIMLFPRLAA